MWQTTFWCHYSRNYWYKYNDNLVYLKEFATLLQYAKNGKTGKNNNEELHLLGLYLFFLLYILKKHTEQNVTFLAKNAIKSEVPLKIVPESLIIINVFAATKVSILTV